MPSYRENQLKKIINTFDFVQKKDSSKISQNQEKDINKLNEEIFKKNILLSSDNVKEIEDIEK